MPRVVGTHGAHAVAFFNFFQSEFNREPLCADRCSRIAGARCGSHRSLGFFVMKLIQVEVVIGFKCSTSSS